MGGSQSASIKIHASDINLRLAGGADVSDKPEILEDTETGVVSTSSRTDIVSTSSQTIIKRHIYKEQDLHKQIRQKKHQHQLQRLSPNEIKRLVQRGSGISIASSYDSCDRQPEDKVAEDRESYFTETEEEVTETENTVSVTNSNICINRCADTSNCVTSCDTSSKTKCVCSTRRITEKSGVVRNSTDTRNNNVVANSRSIETFNSETTEVPVIHITSSNSVVPSSPKLVCSDNSVKPIAILITEEKPRTKPSPDQSGQPTRAVPDQSPKARAQWRSRDIRDSFENRKIEVLCEQTSNQSRNKRESNNKSIDSTFISSVTPKSPRISNSEVICPCSPSNINRCVCREQNNFNPSKSAYSLKPNNNKCICFKRRSPCLCDFSPKAVDELQKVSTSSASVYDQKFRNNPANNTKRHSKQTKVSSSTEFIKVSTSQKTVHAVKSPEACTREEKNIKTETTNACFHSNSVEGTKNTCEKSPLSFKSVASENKINPKNPQEVICSYAIGQEDKCICEKPKEVVKSKSPCDFDIPESTITKPNICCCGQETEAPCICCPTKRESFHGKFRNHTKASVKPTDSKTPEVSVISRIENFNELISKPQAEDYKTHRNSCATRVTNGFEIDSKYRNADCNCGAQGLICLCKLSPCTSNSPCKSERKDTNCVNNNLSPSNNSPLKNSRACEHTCCCEPLREGDSLLHSLNKIESTTETVTQAGTQSTKHKSSTRINTCCRRSTAKRTEQNSKFHCANSPGNSLEPIDVISTVVTKLPNYHSPKPVLLDVEIFPTMEHPNGLKPNQHKVVVKSYAPPHDKYFENKSSGDVHPRLPRFNSDVDRRRYRKCCNEKCEDSDDWDTYFEPDQDKDNRPRQMMPPRLQRSYLPARANVSQECNCNCNCCGSMNDHRMDKRPDMNCRMLQNGSQTTPSLCESRGASPVSCECCKCRSPSPHSRFRTMNTSPVHMDRSTNTSQNNLYHAKHCARSESTGSCRYTCPCSKYTTPPHTPQYETAESPRYNAYGQNDYEPLSQPHNCNCNHCQRASRNSVRPQRDYGKLPYEKHKKYGDLVNELQHELGSRNNMGYGRKPKDPDDNNERGSRGKCRINETNPWVNKDDFCRSECALCPNERRNGKCTAERKCCGSAEHDRHTIERGRVEKNISKFNSNQDCWTVSK